MTKAVRVYYTCFDNEKSRKIIGKIEEITGIKPIVHNSFIKEFKYVEVRNAEEKHVQHIKKVLDEFLGELSHYRVDYISV